MSVIHMETEAVDQLVNQMRRASGEIENSVAALQSALSRLQNTWESPAADTFRSSLIDVIRQGEASESELEALTTRLQRERDEWLDADASFGPGVGAGAGIAAGAAAGGVAGGAAPGKPLSPIQKLSAEICRSQKKPKTCEEIWKHPPKNAADLAYLIQSLPDDKPIAIIPLGNNEYMVLLRGMTWDFSKGHSPLSAAASFFSHNSSYQLGVLKALRLSNLPPGAKLHLAGHSHGGMVAMNLSSDPRVQKMGLEIEDVTTFGSPDTFAKANPNVTYTMYENADDPVPQIDEFAEGIIHARTIRHPWNIRQSVEAHQLLNDVEGQAGNNRHIIHAAHANLLDAHNYNTKTAQDALRSQTSPPFIEAMKKQSTSTTTWEQVDTYRSSIFPPGDMVGTGLEQGFNLVQAGAGYELGGRL